MERNSLQHETFTRYLLGDLPEAERTRLEEEYFTDDELFENFLSVKDELVDAYARGGLTSQQREQFEKHFLSTPPRREKLHEAKQLIAFATAASASEGEVTARRRGVSWWSSLWPGHRVQSPALGFALAAILLVAALGAVWVFINRSQSGPEQRAAVTRPVPDVGPSPSPWSGATEPSPPGNKGTEKLTDPRPPQNTSSPEKPAPTATHVASLFLTPVLTRGSGPSNTLQVGPNTSEARLRLSFTSGDYRSYSASLETIEGEQVWQGAPRVRSSGPSKSVVMNVPVRVFRKKDYIITLSGRRADGKTQEINEYFFTVQKTNKP